MIMRHFIVGDSGLIDHLGLFDVHPMQGTQAFLHFTPTEMQLPWLGLHSVPSGLVDLYVQSWTNETKTRNYKVEHLLQVLTREHNFTLLLIRLPKMV